MIRRSLNVIALAGGLSIPAHAQPQQEVLTLEKAIEIAERTQPSLLQSRASIEASLGRVDAARVARRPTVSLSASATIGSSAVRPCAADMTKTCGGFFDPTTRTGL
ncbi:MAG: hypothetical protein H0T65_09290, partial [Deltaproteobacteria bacterium]|nr:hypothetical protein [Deltaproteobacteria bacterium]